jgi:plasmid replication initiation protein
MGRSDPRGWMTMVPGVGFDPTSPRLQRGAFTRLASQAIAIGAADGNRTHVCAWATRGSAIELRMLVHRAGLEPAEPEGT